MTTEKFTTGHLTHGLLALPNTKDRDKSMTRSVNARLTVKRLPTPALNWATKQTAGDGK